MKRTKVVYALFIGLASQAVALATPQSASALSASFTVGPLPIPEAQVQVCVNGNCVATPSLTEATVTVSANASGLVLPVITPGLCPAGQIGVVLTISSPLPGTLTIGGQVSGELVSGEPFSIPIGPVPINVGIGETTSVSACTAI